MKIHYSFIVLLFCVTSLLVSCTSDGPESDMPVTEYLTITTNNLTFPSDGGTQQLQFSSPEAWTASLSQSGGDVSWCTISPTSGNAGNNITIDVTTEGNDSYDERNVTVTIATGTQSRNLTVVQKQLNAILISSDKIEINEEGGEFVIEVASNIDFKCEIAPQSQSWIKRAAESRALTTQQLRFIVEENEFVEKREGTIFFTGEGITEEVTVYQAPGKALILSSQRQFLPSSSGRFSIELRSNIEYEWKIATGSEWLHADFTRAMSSHTLYFNYDSNPSELDSRNAQVVFTASNGESVVLDVVQHAIGKIILADNITNIPASGGEFMIRYDATSQMSADYPTWLETVNNSHDTRAIEAYNLWLRAAPNYMEEERRGTLRLYDALNPELSESITICQEGGRTDLKLSCPEGAFNDARTHTFSINVTSNIPYQLVVPEGIKSLGNNQYRIEGDYSEKSASYNIVLLVDEKPAKTSTITRSAPITPRLSKDSFVLSDEGGEFEVCIYCNSDMQISIPSSCDWIKLKNREIAEMGPSTDKWIFTVEANSSQDARNSIIKIEGPKEFKADVTVEQKGKLPTVDSNGRVSLPVAGNLSEALGEELLKSLTAMSISGTINGTDIATIRKMATEYSLINLDLSETTLKADPALVYFSGHTLSNRYPGVIANEHSIGNFMFYRTKLQKITLPKNIKELGFRSFSESEISAIIIPEGVEKMGQDCFNGCHSLQSVSLPSSLKEIPSDAFFECYSLKSVTIPQGVTKIGARSFTPKDATSNKGSLSSLTISNTVTSIGDFAFNCQKLTTVEIPSSVTEMGWNVFKENRFLQSAIFLNNMEELPRGTLESCGALTTLRLPSGLKIIGKLALAHTGLNSFSVPEGVIKLEESALEGMACSSLTLPSTLTTIGSWSLGQLYYLNEITIPAGVTSMGQYAFGSPCKLERIHMLPPSPPEDNGEIFSQNFDYSKCTLFVPKGAKSSYASHRIWGKFKDIREE